jgi:hypothetical protein
MWVVEVVVPIVTTAVVVVAAIVTTARVVVLAFSPVTGLFFVNARGRRKLH